MPKPEAPLKAADKSEWINYAWDAHGIPSYEAWALTVDELHALAPAPAPAKKTTPKAGPTRG